MTDDTDARERRRHIANQDGPHPIDVHVGGRVRLRRLELGFSQEKLGAALNLTFQQVQKYERGTNRIGASRLFEVAQILKTNVSYFFEGVAAAGAQPGLAEDAQPELQRDLRGSRDVQDLVKAYGRIGDPKLRRRLLELARTLAETSDG